ncbi:hypothetical protein [Roseivirga echinicomitans]|uniref:Uncharacterized protein n=1 Tax=Roseivirga echinicomitans TaxID=296218 RepID=A0A150XXM1_9BACT|nr:hypothetical protein [Roseivirga echinicomitans]KYG83394.1 hypothetical protein AWN68_00890 [Roseivirga echinicomitans]
MSETEIWNNKAYSSTYSLPVGIHFLSFIDEELLRHYQIPGDSLEKWGLHLIDITKKSNLSPSSQYSALIFIPPQSLENFDEEIYLSKYKTISGYLPYRYSFIVIDRKRVANLVVSANSEQKNSLIFQNNLYDTFDTAFRLLSILKIDLHRIERRIEFKAEFKLAGIQILSYFQEILNFKYPEIEASVTIKQFGNTVSMEIETLDGHKEIIEKAFEDYQLVISGKKSASDFLSERLQIISLENELKIALLRVENSQNLLKIQSDLISDLKSDKKDLNLKLAQSMRGSLDLQLDLSNLIQAVIKNNNIDHVYQLLELSMGEKPSLEMLQHLKQELKELKEKQPQDFKEFFKNVASGILTNISSPWFIEMVNSIPK